MNEASMIGMLSTTVSFGALLYLACIGELISEKAGVLNLGVEGMMALGAVTGFLVALNTENPWLALLVAMIVTAAFALIHGVFSRRARSGPGGLRFITHFLRSRALCILW